MKRVYKEYLVRFLSAVLLLEQIMWLLYIKQARKNEAGDNTDVCPTMSMELVIVKFINQVVH